MAWVIQQNADTVPAIPFHLMSHVQICACTKGLFWRCVLSLACAISDWQKHLHTFNLSVNREIRQMPIFYPVLARRYIWAKPCKQPRYCSKYSQAQMVFASRQWMSRIYFSMIICSLREYLLKILYTCTSSSLNRYWNMWPKWGRVDPTDHIFIWSRHVSWNFEYRLFSNWQ